MRYTAIPGEYWRMSLSGRELRKGFDAEAARYDRVRPAPPTTLVKAMLTQGRLTPGARVLEVGCGTGQATLPLAERGLHLDALEIGPALAQLARRNLCGYPNVKIHTVAFEAFETGGQFDALVSVQAFHWIDPTLGLALAASHLRADGTLLLAWHRGRSQDTTFHRAADLVYQRFSWPERPTPSTTHAWLVDALEVSRDFHAPRVSHFPWRNSLTKGDYLDLERTFSNVQALDPDERERYLDAIAEVVDGHGGEVEEHYESILVAARRRS